MKSVIQNIQTEEFVRIRVGIGHPDENQGMISYVIGAIPEEEVKILNDGVDMATKAVIEIIKNGADSAMNKYNQR